MSSIRIHRASEHNLKAVSLDVRREALTVFTGVSGSGKSSLAFDTIYREGQRRFLESLPAYARQFLGGFDRPRVDHIDGLSPTISVDQKTVGRSPRSTVGTITEIQDYLRLLFARLGEPHCPSCGRRISSQSAEQICDRVFDLFAGKTAIVGAPLVRERKGEHRSLLEELRRDGHARLLVDGALVRLSDGLPELRRTEAHTIEVAWDRLEVAPRLRSRWVEGIEKCLALSGGVVSVLVVEGAGNSQATRGPERTEGAEGSQSTRGTRRSRGAQRSPGVQGARELFSSQFACPACGIDLPELEPRLFSFNSSHGACPACKGLGECEQVDPELVVADPSLPFSKGGIALFASRGKFIHPELDSEGFAALGKRLGFTSSSSWGDLGEEARSAVLHGDGRYPGLVPLLESLAGRGEDYWVSQYLRALPCGACGGTRLKKEARSVLVAGKGIHEVCAMTIADLRRWFEGLARAGGERGAAAGIAILEPIRKDVVQRLSYLEDVGLGYLTLDRRAGTLAGGEAQRLRLASQVGAGLQGVLFVLDEPSIGLHARDHGRLLSTLAKLRDLGNTVLVVEHDRATMEAADHLVDLGPGAGPLGGEIVAQGTVQDIVAEPRSVTGAYLSGRKEIPLPERRRRPGKAWLELHGVRHNNLKGIDVRIPLGLLVVVTGVSGSGKSSLVNQVLRPALQKKLGMGWAQPGAHRSITGYQHVDKVIEIDQAPIGKSPRSNPATFVKVFDFIRQLFARVPEARARGYTSGRFSFNVEGGRCMECGGAGVTVVEMQFLAPVEVTCDTCGGMRYNRETLEVRYRGKNVHDVLEMTIGEAREFFRDHPKIHRPLDVLCAVGLGYMKLGQPSTTLSGGEAQRVKLAAELRKRETGKTLYLLDEPTTGLHFEDIRVLVQALQELVSRGNTVIVIEHNLDVVAVADHVIDLGPEAGEDGGRIVAQGSPEEVAGVEGSHTGKALRAVLERAPTAEARAARVAPAVCDAQACRAGPAARETPAARGISEGAGGPATQGALAGPGAERDIEVFGACQHNLKSIDVRIPHGSLTVITGVSGSGKSSLAFDTLFAEGQRRYLESLSTYARRFLGRLPGADVRRVSGLSPTIAIDQRSAAANPRSTVATITEIHDYLRLLYARAGTPHCPSCGVRLEGASPSRLAADLVERHPDEKAFVLAPIDLSDVRLEAGGLGAILLKRAEALRTDLLKSGFTRVLAGGDEVRLDEEGNGPLRRLVAALKRAVEERGALRRADLLLVVDRIVASERSQTRLAGSLELAFERGGGTAAVRLEGSEISFHTRWPSCPLGHFAFLEELSPSLFSFSSHQGACPECKGLGLENRPDPDAILPHPERPLLEALDPAFVEFVRSWRPSTLATLRGLCRLLGVRADAPFRDLSEDQRRAILSGLEGAKVPLELESGLRIEAAWPGILPQVTAWAREDSWVSLPMLKRYLRLLHCSSCGGGRLRRESLAVRVGGLNIRELSGLTVRAALRFFSGLALPPREATIAEQVLAEVRNRLEFLEEVGLGYLGLDRPAGTLSGGEAQRIRLASQLGNRLAGVLYVLDEPTVGLHQRDTRRLLKSLKGLRDLGNTVIVVEHDRETLLEADWIVDVGPGAGSRGGEVVAVGTPAEVARHPASLTGKYLREGGGSAAERTGSRRKPAPRCAPGGAEGGSAERAPTQGWIELEGVRHNNLADLSVAFPLGLFTAVTGVSGSGKSSLVLDVLAEAVGAHLREEPPPEGRWARACGLDALRRLVVVDQQPIGRTPRSNPATYTGLWDHVRELYESLPASRVRGYTASRFSFNTGDGKCLACDGQGARQVEMHFLSDVWIPCEHCRGKRFDRETLAILFKGKSVGDVLELEVDQACELFENQPKILRILRTLQAVGLGYIRLGQSADTLSGGEAQRVKLASELFTRHSGGTLYVLDEPTTGLHHEDVRRLLEVLHALVDGGNTLVVIEHQLDVILSADWVIDLGPEAGEEGGRVVAEGTPEDVARVGESHTGRYLASAG